MAVEPSQERLSSSSTLLSSFLCLPVYIRENIYEALGLVRRCPINIEEESVRWRRLRAAFRRHIGDPFGNIDDNVLLRRRIIVWHRSKCIYDQKYEGDSVRSAGIGCIHPTLPIYLFLVCKQVRTEAQRVLYSRNLILLGPTLLGLPSVAISMLTNLEIQMTTCSCRNGHQCLNLEVFEEFNDCKICHHGCKRGSGNPLSLKSSRFEVTSKRWTELCIMLKENCSKNLELTIICDCEDMPTAREVVQRLQGFPRLRDANVRLAQSHNAEIQQLAEQTAHQLIGTTEKIFPFEKLPYELQYQILGYTDLVAGDLISCFLPPHQPIEGQVYVPPRGVNPGFRLLHDTLLVCCLRCTPSRQVCVCPGRHSAYTSHICACWQFPRSLFLVNKWFNEHAIKIFFSRNEFLPLWSAKSI